MNLLLVEDEARVADFIQRGLRAEGYAVTVARDGETAVGLLDAHAFDIVVLDLMLPGISGQAVCQRMRSVNDTTPVLMLTALDAVDDRVGELRFDGRSLEVSCCGQAIELSAKERDILKLLMTDPGRVFSRERILNAIWAVSEDPLTNIVDVYIGRLRKKLGPCGEGIKTVRGAGYRLSPCANRAPDTGA